MKQLGVTHLLSVSAVGSLTERYPPLTLVCPDQIIDRTIFRDRTFFDTWRGRACRSRPSVLPGFASCADQPRGGAGISVQRGGTYVAIEGPQFSTIGPNRSCIGPGARRSLA